MAIEIEVKIRVREAVALRARILGLGFTVVRERRREQNWLFDDSRGALRAAGKILRLRRAGEEWLLTAKGPQRPGGLKRREEAQTAIRDGASCRKLLEMAGFRGSGGYALWRTLYRREGEGGDLAWDETAAGTFLEIEGTAAWVRRTAGELGLKVAEAEPRTYPELLIARRPRGRR